MKSFDILRPSRLVHALVLAGLLSGAAAWGQSGARRGDYIVAIVNQELVTAAEVEQRLAQIRANASRSNARLPPTRSCTGVSSSS